MTPESTQIQSSAVDAVVPFDELIAIYVLEAVPQFGPKTFHSVYEAGLSFRDILHAPNRLPGRGKRIDKIRHLISEQAEGLYPGKVAFARNQIAEAKKHSSTLLTYGHPDYPKNVLASNNPIPILYARGNSSVLRETRAVACVGSREIRYPYAEFHRRFATLVCEESYVVVSGFALGADTIGHRAALECHGRTVCVMPCGLQRPFPPENKDLWEALLQWQGGVFVSEFPFGIRASALTLRKRNKLIVACALGVLVSQSSSLGGAMNAYRFAIEQKKPVATFEPDRETSLEPDAATSGNAEIQNSQKAVTTTFARDNGQDQAFRAWISRLSYSI